ncbi:mitochondrial distribution and morphology protein family 31/32 [Viridothelium virens]|uniref:Mitochondrial distribution and morphology protein family 31/32 n=1 Tax=Viridothelium virens TaxID=1048519 RepID=A0A6A6HHW9_VIRVR|nr:mitochondrial distribution and morphology protein family 31/32 [Viridothelium virens]
MALLSLLGCWFHLPRQQRVYSIKLIWSPQKRCWSRHDVEMTWKRYKSSKNNDSYGGSENAPKDSVPNPNAVKQNSGSSSSKWNYANSASAKAFLERLPRIPNHLHRPSKEEVLALATGFWSRLRLRFKWFTIRSARPFTLDEISAFFSWILLGHVIWIILGTTTFFSLAIWMVNTVLAQETLARWVGNYLTKSTGLQVVFESAIVPRWGDGVIRLNNVFVSRRPGQGQGKVQKGSQTSAAAAAAAAALAEKASGNTGEEDEDTNYTQFDVSIDTVNITLSFAKWFNGKGLLRSADIKGIRGVIDRTSVQQPTEPVDPRIYKHEHDTGDFELESFKMEDLLVTVYQPGSFRPFTVSVYSCDLPQLRKQWLFYDFMSANMMSGSFDNSLFTIHPRQVHNQTGTSLMNGVEADAAAPQWKKHSRLRIDGLNIDHLNRGVTGPFSWIHEGNVDIVADMMLPADNDESIAKVMSDVYDRVEATVTSNSKTDVVNEPPEGAFEQSTQDDRDKRFLVMDLRVHLCDVRAHVPIWTRDISYVNNALIRPIVAYINSKRTFIPVNCRVVKSVDEFDGSWTIFDSGLMDDLSRETYDAFAHDIMDNQARTRRIKKVGLWTLQLAAQALFIGLAGHLA